MITDASTNNTYHISKWPANEGSEGLYKTDKMAGMEKFKHKT
jgi:hypothetical protein